MERAPPNVAKPSPKFAAPRRLGSGRRRPRQTKLSEEAKQMIVELTEDGKAKTGAKGYNVLECIGRGKFSVVYKADQGGRWYALKKVQLFEMSSIRAREKCLKEIRLIQSMSHPNIVKYIDSFIANEELIIVLEWAEGGDLKHLITRVRKENKLFSERQVWNYAAQLAAGLKHMHEKRVMHRDLKPANIMLTKDNRINIGDLGLSRYFTTNTLEAFSKVGTPLYMSPEVLHGEGYTFSADVWSLGCIFYELCMLKSPFKPDKGVKNLFALSQKIKSGKYDLIPANDRYSANLRKLIYSMILLDPNKRTKMEKILEISLTNLEIQTELKNKRLIEKQARNSSADNSARSLPDPQPRSSGPKSPSPQPKSKPNRKSELKPKLEAESKPKLETKSEPKSKPMSEPKSKPKSEPNLKPKSKPRTMAETKPEGKFYIPMGLSKDARTSSQGDSSRLGRTFGLPPKSAYSRKKREIYPRTATKLRSLPTKRHSAREFSANSVRKSNLSSSRSEGGTEKRLVDSDDVSAFTLMDILLEKLKMLDYETGFCSTTGFRPIEKTFFAIKSAGLRHKNMLHSPESSFYKLAYAHALILWLTWTILKDQLGHNFQSVWDVAQSHVQPEHMLASIEENFQKIGLELSLPLSSLREGYGLGMCRTLLEIAGKALTRQIQLKGEITAKLHCPRHPRNVHLDETIDETPQGDIHENSEDSEEKIEDEMQLNTRAVTQRWYLEVETLKSKGMLRFKPKLHGWSHTVDTAKRHSGHMRESNSLKPLMSKMSQKVTESLERIRKFEKSLQNLKITEQLREAQRVNELAISRYDATQQAVEEQVAKLDHLQTKIEREKRQLTDENDRINDRSIVDNCRKAIASLKTENAEMEVRIGVLLSQLHSFLHPQL